MAYQVLARKWRPQDFSSVVGQEPIVTALRNAIAEGRIAQAYLFSGIRGVGKTTAARVFAKALNCERGPLPDPCNDCAVCRDITAGADLDVLEVDAATYSKVEQVRELVEGLRYSPPARDRYKVVILDEVHRLSRAAFDALLKVVEEPPPWLVFIFATTEIEAVPATILSRCQEFQFRRVPVEKVAAHLADLAGRENISVAEPALRMIARAGEGSMRDAVALLDQLATFGGGKIADEDAARLLGGLDTALFERVLEAILSGDGATVSNAARDIENDGWDPRNVFARFLAYVRDALHLALGGDPARLDLPREESTRLAELARRAGSPNLLRLLHQLLGAENLVRRSDAPAIALEISWLRAAELPRVVAIEELLAGGAPTPSGGPARTPPPSPSRPVPPPGRPAEPPLLGPPPTITPRTSGDPAETFFEAVSREKPPLAAHLRESRPSFTDGVLRLHVAPGDSTLRRRLERDENREVVNRLLRDSFGPTGRWEILEGSAPAASAATSAQAPPAAHRSVAPLRSAAIEEHETVQTVLEIFGGSVESVEPNEENSP
jgi:DNA polymerase-3 subunit gamma/tau